MDVAAHACGYRGTRAGRLGLSGHLRPLPSGVRDVPAGDGGRESSARRSVTLGPGKELGDWF